MAQINAMGLDATTGKKWFSSDSIVVSAKTQMSVTSDSNGLKLSGDSATPGNNKVYGTNGSGTKGWKDDPAGGGYSVTEVTTASSSPSDTSGHRVVLANLEDTSWPSGYPVPTETMLAQQNYYAIYLANDDTYIFVNFVDTANSGLFDYSDRIIPSCYTTRHMWLWSGSSWSEISWSDAKVIKDGNLFERILANYDMKCQICDNDVEDHYPDFPHDTYYTGVTAPTNNYPVPDTCTINLPTAVSNTAMFTVKKLNTANVIIDPNSTQTVDGSSTKTISTTNESLTLISDNANWKIISKYTP